MVIRQRETFKVLGDPDNPRSIPDAVAQRCQQEVREALQTAGWAPFHYDRKVDGLAEPWRATLLWHPSCQELAVRFSSWFPEVSAENKLPKMLAACGALALISWLPQFRSLENPTPAQQAIDDEHLAAAAAMVQNFLLSLTVRGMGTYWSSGGVLGSEDCFRRLGMTSTGQLLAAVFIEFPEMREEFMERKPGKLREARCTNWIQEIGELPS